MLMRCLLRRLGSVVLIRQYPLPFQTDTTRYWFAGAAFFGICKAPKNNYGGVLVPRFTLFCEFRAVQIR